MKTVIVNLNSKYIHSSLAPWYLCEAVRLYCPKDIEAGVIEGTVNEEQGVILDRIVSSKPDVIGFCCYIWNISYVKSIAEKIKKILPECRIVLGGPEVSFNAEYILKFCTFVDFIISGEGEKPFSKLLTSLYLSKDYSKIGGLCFRKGDDITISAPFISKEDPPSPFSDGYFNSLNNRIAYIETTRGCPFSCTFCLSSRCTGVHKFDIERSKQDILRLANSGTSTVKFVDRTFNAYSRRSNEIINFIIQNYGTNIPTGVCFHFEIAGDILTDDTISLLQNAPKGLFRLEIGLQSFNGETLSKINRKTDVKRLENHIRALLKNQNMHIHIDLIAGLPLEDYNSFRDSFNKAYRLKPNMLQLGFLKLLHGTELRENAENFSCFYNESPPYEVISTNVLSESELSKLHSIEDSLERIYNSGRFLGTTDYIIERSGISPFDFFESVSEYMAAKSIEKIPLDSYTNLLFDFLKGLKNIDKSVLRDVMILDRISTNPSGQIPQNIRLRDKNLKKIRLYLENQEKTASKKGIKRNIAILYSQKKAVYVDYENKDSVSGKYAVKSCDFVLE